ncbi:uncharacterized protein METZ01_LOCUS316063 [marine metagenome]|uniref:Uncharacterized protein n=1 Tax=marine metagenome TaxID=408172 RepID=A0A382NPU5_9ZZZZ
MSVKTNEKVVTQVTTANPLEGEDLLAKAFFGGGPRARNVQPKVEEPVVQPTARRSAGPVRKAAPKPSHYKIVSISLYNEDIERLEKMVRELKKRGHYKANKSQLIRQALAKLDLDSISNEI